jgi:diguanylate cyclase (GGDEF)-like protein
MKTKKPKKIIYIFIAFAVWLVQIAIFSFLLYFWFDSERSVHINQELAIHRNGIESLKVKFDTIAQTTFDSSINTEEVSHMMAQASSSTSDKELDLIRKKLYSSLLPVYKSLENNSLRQLHFHLPGNISFLRFHRPNKFGDSLVGTRPTIDTVNKTHIKVSGFEEGRIFNGFRHVFPLFYKQKFVGTVEVSYSFSAIKDLAEGLYRSHTDMLLRREIVEEKVFNNEQSNYKVSTLSSRYLNDKAVQKCSHHYFHPDLIEAINRSLAPSISDIMDNKNDQGTITILNAQMYLVLLNTFQSFDGTPAGYIVSYIQEDDIPQLEKRFWKLFIISIIIISIVTFLLTYMYYRLQLQKNAFYALANTDKLTSISNRTHLMHQIDYLMAQSDRNNQPLSLIFFDIDHFKEVNDNYGHHHGDQVLIELSLLIEKRLRRTDLFGRWGGEEFLIILPNTGEEQGKEIAENLRLLVASHPFSHGSITCSFGVAQYQKGEDFDTWINRADSLLYEAKSNGRNCVFPHY